MKYKGQHTHSAKSYRNSIYTIQRNLKNDLSLTTTQIRTRQNES